MRPFDLRPTSGVRLLWSIPTIVVVLMAAPCWPSVAQGQDEKGSPEKSAEAAIRASADAFVEAFNRGDAKAVADLWTVNGTMADDRGEIFKGRPTIEDQYAEFFKAYPGARMVVTIKSIDFPTPSMAVEDGTAQVVAPQAGPPVASRYTAVHILDDGKWRMTSVRETAIPLSSNFSRLEELGWLIGTWETKHDATSIRATYRWIANKSFIARDYSVHEEGVETATGLQIIGWDPQAGQVRSWSFDASGGYGSSLWTATPEGWHCQSTGVLADGTPTSSEELLIRVPGEDRVLGWRSFARVVGDVALPDTSEVVLDRQPEKK